PPPLRGGQSLNAFSRRPARPALASAGPGALSFAWACPLAKRHWPTGHAAPYGRCRSYTGEAAMRLAANVREEKHPPAARIAAAAVLAGQRLGQFTTERDTAR